MGVDMYELSTAAWVEIIVPVIVGLLIMLLYGYWDKIVHKVYYVDDDILAYDEEIVKAEKEGEK
ncbi:hypothetical protein [Candidatus Aciduliprofundum boonei]|uniref:Uncharacterized protein n=1 Tax=Aciduliprofundum boonei (strain DSM 19572 / T469) TaxID=439481 RepID=D3T9Z4_ACIB4|nr:hypothetical protein [Candidatus Aciduliprofundum boonei]ADD08923.1 conserved hypothetical protein [Aciduliprofundum boonei T469]HII54762.1 hypothetical protein [Candidatus Aciduliprofundum boonei]